MWGEEHRGISAPPDVFVYKSWMELMALGLHPWDCVSHGRVFSVTPPSGSTYPVSNKIVLWRSWSVPGFKPLWELQKGVSSTSFKEAAIALFR